VNGIVAAQLSDQILEVSGLVVDVSLDHDDPVEVILHQDAHRSGGRFVFWS
jgi:hypothetical protein